MRHRGSTISLRLEPGCFAPCPCGPAVCRHAAARTYQEIRALAGLPLPRLSGRSTGRWSFPFWEFRLCNGSACGSESVSMSTSFQHPSHLGRLSQADRAAGEREARAEPAAVYRPPLRYSRRACCCPALPSVVAVIPPADGRRAPVELLLCGHHYRQSRQALAAIGATLLDLKGHALTPGMWPEPGC